MIKKAIRKGFQLFGYDIFRSKKYFLLPKENLTYAHDLLYTYHNCDFIRDQKFSEAYQLGKATDVNYSVLGKDEQIYWRVHVLCWAAAHAKKLEGDFVDCGVNTGIFARAVIHYVDFNQTGKKYYLLDTFSGFDERYSTAEEIKKMGSKYAGNKDLYNEVQKTFSAFNVKIIKGAIPDTLPLVDADRIAFLSIDMNSVRPEVEALRFFWDKIVPSGVIILDDYGFQNMFLDQKKAHDDFASSKGTEILTLPTGQGLIIKPR